MKALLVSLMTGTQLLLNYVELLSIFTFMSVRKQLPFLHKITSMSPPKHERVTILIN